MRKFKHTSTGIIGELNNDGHLHFARKTGGLICFETFWFGFVENSDDWKEVFNENWRVESFVCLSLNKKYVRHAVKNWCREDVGSRSSSVEERIEKDTILRYETMLNSNDFAIYSVKRLSDNVVFSIKDFVSWGLEKKDAFKIKIKSFSIVDSKLMICYDRDGYDNLERGLDLPCYHKIENILFVADDGIPILENDEYYFVQPEAKRIESSIAKSNLSFEANNVRFSTRANAYDYLVLKKRCLSIFDLIYDFKNGKSLNRDTETLTINLKDLKQYVKSKLL